MSSGNVLRPLGALSGAVSVFSALLLLAGLAVLGAVGYETFGPGNEPLIVVSAENAPGAADAPERVATQEEADAAYYEAMRNGPDPYAYRSQTPLPTVQTHAAGLISHLQTDGIAWPTRLALAAIVLVALGYVISGLMWVWRAHANLATSGIVSRHTPLRTVASYLIPGVNLVLPFEAMRELYNRSHGEPEELANATVDDVTAWWAASLIGLLIISALIAKFGLDLATNLIIMTPLWMEFLLVAFAVLVLLAAALLRAKLIREISAAQRDNLVAVTEDQQATPVRERPTVRYATRTES